MNPREGDAIPWTEGTVLFEDADKKGYLEKAQIQTRNTRYMRETKLDKERIAEIRGSSEFVDTFFINAQAIRENRTQNNNAIYLDTIGGSSLDSVVHTIMELHRAGQPVVTTFNSFKIDTRQYGSEQAVVEAYDRAREEYQKSKRMLQSGIEATEESVRTEQINNEVGKMSEIQKGKDVPKEVEESTLE